MYATTFVATVKKINSGYVNLKIMHWIYLKKKKKKDVYKYQYFF